MIKITGLQTDDATLSEAQAALQASDAVGYIVFPSDGVVTLHGGADLVERAELLRRVVSVYNGRADIHRVRAMDLAGVAEHYEHVAGLIVFPEFASSDILALVREGGALPSGISRHVIPGRALRVGYAMAELADEAPLADKNRHLADWIRRKRQANQIRAYEESTVLYDE